MIREFDVLAARMLGNAVASISCSIPQAGACKVDPAQFGSALLNLVLNARDAMPEGGRLTVSSRTVTLDPARAAHLGDALPGWYVAVEVRILGRGCRRRWRSGQLSRSSPQRRRAREPGRALVRSMGSFASQAGS